jgi:hypothetical protein
MSLLRGVCNVLAALFKSSVRRWDTRKVIHWGGEFMAEMSLPDNSRLYSLEVTPEMTIKKGAEAPPSALPML